MRILSLLILLCSCAVARPQPPTVVVDFFVDNTGKTYRLLANDNLVLANPLGQNNFEFYDSSLGAPTSIDVSSPFAILLFYADYGVIVVLDRTLSEVSRIDLLSLESVEQPVAAARASDNGIWVFDSWDYHLKLLDERGQLRLESNDLRLEIKEAAVPDAIYVDRGRVLLHYVDAQKIGVFTNYGRFDRWVELPAATHFGWCAPLLTGTTEAGYWTLDALQKEARPWLLSGVEMQVQGKVVAADGGRYQLQEGGTISFRQ
jgi:hypothetical protein